MFTLNMNKLTRSLNIVKYWSAGKITKKVQQFYKLTNTFQSVTFFLFYSQLSYMLVITFSKVQFYFTKSKAIVKENLLLAYFVCSCSIFIRNIIYIVQNFVPGFRFAAISSDTTAAALLIPSSSVFSACRATWRKFISPDRYAGSLQQLYEFLGMVNTPLVYYLKKCYWCCSIQHQIK